MASDHPASCSPWPAAICALAALLLSSCEPERDHVGTPEQRAALAEELIRLTSEREAFSPVKNARMAFDPLGDMEALWDDVVSAGDPAQLFYALTRLSNARRDRHLEVALVPGGLELPDSAGLAVWGQADPPLPQHAAVRFLPDFSSSERLALFVSDQAAVAGGLDLPALGDRVVEINGRSVDDHLETVRPYVRHSSQSGLWWMTAEMLPQRTAALPPDLYRATLDVLVESRDGERRAYSLPYHEPDSLTWADTAEPRYPGFRAVFRTGTYDLHRSEGRRPAVLLRWHGFRETLVEDVDSLVAYAAALDLLDNALIVDATRSRGGSRGPYALQRMTPRPFRTTFGNLKISDVIEPFTEIKRAEHESAAMFDGSVPETIDDGTWLMDWLETDVRAAAEAGEAYSNNVPFKLAHAHRHSDGILQPAPVHFRGPLVVFSGPRRGSHLDQFVAMVADNDLGVVIGMPAGGYSNTWEWEEEIQLPGSGRPLVGFMWSIGHTIRPNGEILEGNPADPDVYLPITRDNFDRYYDLLLAEALRRIGAPLS